MSEFDRDEHEGGGGFMMGLLTGTVLGAGLGMLLAPKSGSELRSQIGDQARRAAGAAGHMAERARGVVRGAAEDVRSRSHERIAGTAGAGSDSGADSNPGYGGSAPAASEPAGVTGDRGAAGTSTYTGTPGTTWAPLTDEGRQG